MAWVEAVHGRCVLTDIADFRHFQLSGPSAEVWSRIDGCASDDAVVRAVLASYPDHPDTADAECRSFIQTMTDIGLLLLQPGSGRGEPDDDDHPAHGGRVAQPAQKGPIA